MRIGHEVINRNISVSIVSNKDPIKNKLKNLEPDVDISNNQDTDSDIEILTPFKPSSLTVFNGGNSSSCRGSEKRLRDNDNVDCNKKIKKSTTWICWCSGENGNRRKICELCGERRVLSTTVDNNINTDDGGRRSSVDIIFDTKNHKIDNNGNNNGSNANGNHNYKDTNRSNSSSSSSCSNNLNKNSNNNTGNDDYKDTNRSNSSGSSSSSSNNVNNNDKKNVCNNAQINNDYFNNWINDDTDENMSKGSTSKGSTSEGSTSKGSTSEGSTSKGSTSKGSTSEGSTSKGSTSEGSTSKGSTSEGSTSKGSTSEGSTSKGSTSEGSTNKIIGNTDNITRSSNDHMNDNSGSSTNKNSELIENTINKEIRTDNRSSNNTRTIMEKRNALQRKMETILLASHVVIKFSLHITVYGYIIRNVVMVKGTVILAVLVIYI
jgi:hypothetical protein